MTAVGWPIGPGDRLLLARHATPSRPQLPARLNHCWWTVVRATRATVHVVIDDTQAPRWVHRDHVVALVHPQPTAIQEPNVGHTDASARHREETPACPDPATRHALDHEGASPSVTSTLVPSERCPLTTAPTILTQHDGASGRRSPSTTTAHAPGKD